MLADAASKKPAVVPGKAVPSKSPAASAPTEQTPAAKVSVMSFSITVSSAFNAHLFEEADDPIFL